MAEAETSRSAVPGGDQDWAELVPLDRLTPWMDAQGLPGGPIEHPRLLTGGTQNILLRFERGGREYVLRRPPKHLRANSNETMRREARVLAALAGTDVRHPALIAACPAEDVIGAAFYLMAPVDGFLPRDEMPALHAGDAAIRHRMGLEMADAIAALGKVDYAARGLSDLGKVDGYLERQGRRAGAPSWRATPSTTAGRGWRACRGSARSAPGWRRTGRPASPPA